MTNRQVKLNINGINYKITGIDKTISYKDILCTIAKQNEILCSKEGDMKSKAKQKQKQIVGKKETPLKSKRISNLKEKELSEIEKSRQIKIIYIGQDVGSERLLRKRIINRDDPHNGEATKRAQDDSDIEVYHKSRRRMKNILKRKWRDESDQKVYEKQVLTGASLPKTKPTQRRNQSQNRFMNEWDKISIYYLDEGLDKQKQHKLSPRKSNCGSPMDSLISKASSASSSIKKRPPLDSITTESNFGDDKDSGIPSWESEEISSKDDNRTDEKVYQGMAEPIACYSNEESNQENISLGLRIDESKDYILREISGGKIGEIDTTVVTDCERHIENTEDQKWERDLCYISKQLFEERCNEETDNKDKNWTVTPEKELEDDAAVASDFEIIITEHTESSVSRNVRGGENETLNSVESRHVSQAQKMNVAYDINSNEVHSAVTTFKKEAKFNQENRGSFILIEFDDSQLSCMDGDHTETVMPKSFMGDDFVGDDYLREIMTGVPQMKAEPRALQASQQSSTRLDNKGWPDLENKRVKGEKSAGGKDDKFPVLKGNCAGKPINETDKDLERCQRGVEKEQYLREETVCSTCNCSTSSEPDVHRFSEQDRLRMMKTTSQSKVSRHVRIREDFDSNVANKNCETKDDVIIGENQNCFSEKLIEKKQQEERESGKEEISIKLKQNEKFQKKESEIGEMIYCDVEETNLPCLVDETESTNKGVECYYDKFIEDAYRKAMNFTQKDDKLIIKLVSKFAKQIEAHLKTKFYDTKGIALSRGGPLLLGHDRKDTESLITMKSNSTRRELWTRYTNVCRNIYRLLEKLLFFDLKVEQMKFELEEVKELESLYNDEAWNDDGDDIVKEIIEFRNFLKKVTIVSRKNRSELRATQAQIEKLDLIIYAKRSLLKSNEESLSLNRCKNIPRKLLRNTRMKNRR